MEIGKLTVSARAGKGKGVSRQLRIGGLVPGVCYGAGIENPLSISIDPKALKASLDPEKRRNTVIDLTIEGGSSPLTTKAMVWDYQIDPIKRNLTHVDIKAIDPSVSVEADVPVILKGKAKGLVNGGQLSVARHTVLIDATPENIPARLELDVSDLDLGDVLHVSDIAIPDDVILKSPGSLTIVTCLAPKAAAAEAAPAEGDAEGTSADSASGETETKEGGDANKA